MRRLWIVTIVGALIGVSSCGSDSESSGTDIPATDPPPTAAPATDPPVTDPPPTEPPPTDPPVADPPPDAIVVGEPDAAGVVEVSIDGERLDPLFDSFLEGDDPLYMVHTQQENIFVGVEMYTVFGDAWTGELGTFPTDCTTHGICVYLDPDGTGPLVGGGPAADGTVTITQLEGSRIVTIDDATIVAEDGQVYTMSGLTLAG